MKIFSYSFLLALFSFQSGFGQIDKAEDRLMTNTEEVKEHEKPKVLIYKKEHLGLKTLKVYSAYAGREVIDAQLAQKVFSEDALGKIYYWDFTKFLVYDGIKWDPFYDENNTEIEKPLSVIQDNNGSIIILTKNKLIHSDGKTTNSIDNVNGNEVNDYYKLIKDNEQNIWLIGRKNIAKKNSENKWELFDLDGYNKLVYQIIHDNKGNIWARGQTGVLRIADGKVATYNKKNGLLGNSVLDMMLVDGQLWVLVGRKGVNIWQESKWASIGKENGLRALPTLSKFEKDKNNHVWLLSYDKIQKIDPKLRVSLIDRKTNFDFLPSLTQHTDIHFSKDEIMWLATVEGLYYSTDLMNFKKATNENVSFSKEWKNLGSMFNWEEYSDYHHKFNSTSDDSLYLSTVAKKTKGVDLLLVGVAAVHASGQFCEISGNQLRCVDLNSLYPKNVETGVLNFFKTKNGAIWLNTPDSIIEILSF